MKALNSKLLSRFLELASHQLKGEWLLLGGTLLPAVGLEVRPTIDIDLVGLSTKERNQNLELMEIAEKLGLGIETINQAADFFLRKVGYAKTDLIPLKKGKNAIIYRPSVFLYWSLKILRLSESDLLDCKHYFLYCKSSKDSVPLQKLKSLIQSELQKNQSADHSQRLHKLSELLN